MIKITVNRNKVDIEMHDKEEEVVLTEIAVVMNAMGDCLHDLRAKNNLSDKHKRTQRANGNNTAGKRQLCHLAHVGDAAGDRKSQLKGQNSEPCNVRRSGKGNIHRWYVSCIAP